jgi:hypothetical protein
MTCTVYKIYTKKEKYTLRQTLNNLILNFEINIHSYAMWHIFLSKLCMYFLFPFPKSKYFNENDHDIAFSSKRSRAITNLVRHRDKST